MESNTSLTTVFSLAASLVGLVLAQVSGTTQQVDRDVPQKAVVVLSSTRGNEVGGQLILTATASGVRIQGEVAGLEPGKHGFHIHEFGDLRDAEGKSAGDHFNPTNARHGSPDDAEHHAGDLGNIEANGQGVAEVDMQSDDIQLHFVIGRALVVHAGEDDFTSQPSGDAGGRVALGVIGIAKSDN
jgi:superoxide dismutase, Cu-Zn family